MAIHNKITKLEYYFLFLCVIFLGSATIYTKNSLESFASGSEGFLPILIGKSFMILYAIIILQKRKISLKKIFPPILILSLIFFGILQYLKYKIISPFVVMRFMNIFFTSVIILVYKKNLFPYLDRILTILSKISIFGWILVLIARPLVALIAELSPIESAGLVDGNSFVVFGMSDSIRNIGFAWEAGRFGSIMATGILINLIINQFKIRNNNHLAWQIAALLSSMSTTAFLAFIFIIFAYLYNKNSSSYFLIGPIVLIGIFALMQLDFMYDKIKDLWISKERMNQVSSVMAYYASIDSGYVPQRFEGAFFELQNIIHDPILGNAYNPQGYLYHLYGVRLTLSNGFLRIFANFGVLLGVVYYYYIFKGSKYLSEIYNYKGKWMFALFFIVINVSYSWIFEPLYLAFFWGPLYLNNKEKINKIKS